MSDALAGVRVVDLSTGIAGPVAAMLLADFGADVVKVEPPAGDPARTNPGFAVWNRNKRSVIVDPADPAASGRLARWLARADVCVSGAGPEDKIAGVDLAAALAANPRLVILTAPPYAGPAPWAGAEESNELLGAVTGLALRQSSFEDAPVDAVYPHVLYIQGIWGAACTMAALVERERSGRGQVVTVDGMHAALVAGTATFVLDPASAGQPVVPAGPGGPHPCYTRYECGDGRWLFLGALTAKFQVRALDLLGLGDLVSDPRMAGELERMLLPENNGWVRQEMAQRFKSLPRQEWLDRLDAADCPAGPLLNRDDWLDHPQIRAIDMALEVSDAERGEVVMPGIPLVLPSSPGEVRSGAPLLGEHSADDVDWDAPTWIADQDPLRPAEPVDSDGAPGGGPLSGTRVLDLGTVLAGPFAGCLLAELGADVIKVEPPEGDSFRLRGFTYNRGMRSIAVDLRSDAGRQAFYGLVRSSDVVIDNYRTGVLQRLKIDYESLIQVNPDIVSFSITGFGDRGPLAAKPGFDPILQGMSGMMIAQGGDSEPVFLTIAVNDITGAAFGVLATCLSLFHRARTSEGQAMSASLAAFSAFMQTGELVRFPGRASAIWGGRDFPGPGALDRYYRAVDGWVRLQAGRDQLDALKHAGLLPDVSDPACTDQELSDALAGDISHRSAAALVAELSAAGIPAAVARRPIDLLNDSRVMQADVLHEHHLGDGRQYFTPGRYARFSRTEQTETLVAPGLGEHSRAILMANGVGESEVQRLIDDGVVIDDGPLRLQSIASYR